MAGTLPPLPNRLQLLLCSAALHTNPGGIMIKLAIRVFIFLLALALLALAGCGPDRRELLKSARDTSVKTPEFKAPVKKFVSRAKEASFQVFLFMDKVNGEIELLETGAGSRQAAYRAAERAKRWCAVGAAKMGGQKLEGMSTELEALCREIADNLTKSFTFQRLALTELQEYLENQSLKSVNDFKEYLVLAESHKAAADLDLEIALIKVGAAK
jgi:dsRNA-specific ribonuclease